MSRPSAGPTASVLTRSGTLAARIALWWLDGLAYHGAATVGVPADLVVPPSASLLRARAAAPTTVRAVERWLADAAPVSGPRLR